MIAVALEQARKAWPSRERSSAGLVIQRSVQAGCKRSLANRKLGAMAVLSCPGSPVAWHFRQGAAVLVNKSPGHFFFRRGDRLDLLRNVGLRLAGHGLEERAPACGFRRRTGRTSACALASRSARRCG